MKAKKTESANADRRVWCYLCSVRIAPSEARAVSGGKIYHAQCFSKLKAPKT
jgi:hypothetical protein